MVEEEPSKKECACTQRLRDLLRATPPKESILVKVTCANCRKVFWTNPERKYCFDCEVKRRE